MQTLLKPTEIPVAYHHFQKAQKLPYLVFSFPLETLTGDDERNLIRKQNVQVELYILYKDTELEQIVEKCLENYSIYKTEVYLESERMYQIIYEFECIEKIRGNVIGR